MARSASFNPRARTGRDAWRSRPDLRASDVSIHAPVRGATADAGRSSTAGSMFQSTRPYGARHADASLRECRVRFNPRARTGRDVLSSRPDLVTCEFQSTRPYGARRSTRLSRGDRRRRFNPRARTGRDDRVRRVSDRRPTFQSTRPYGARLRARSSHAYSSSFNPRARTGRDAYAWTTVNGLSRVSIHAPVRGATDGHGRQCSGHYMFQSTRPYGARLLRTGILTRSKVSIHAPVRGATMRRHCSKSRTRFNPRARTGRDRSRQVVDSPHRDRFNPRARTGRDTRSIVDAKCVDHVSIHAPVRGATHDSAAHGPHVMVSIHAPVRGATLQHHDVEIASSCFNPRARTGRDDCSLDSRSSARMFQSTRPYGARQSIQ